MNCEFKFAVYEFKFIAMNSYTSEFMYHDEFIFKLVNDPDDYASV